MYLEIGIQSVSDIITNSSSEIFSVYSDLSKEELLDLLRKVNSSFHYKGSYDEWLKGVRYQKLQCNRYRFQGNVC